jgi:hypothetical protein
MAEFELPADPDDERASHVDAWRTSGKSQRTYARTHGLQKTTFNEQVIGFESQYLAQILRARRKRQTKLMDPEQPWRKKSNS